MSVSVRGHHAARGSLRSSFHDRPNDGESGARAARDRRPDGLQDRQGLQGKAMFQMLGVFAEFDRSIIQERVRAGLARAKADGKRVLTGLVIPLG
jgi:resolvase-like protein